MHFHLSFLHLRSKTFNESKEDEKNNNRQSRQRKQQQLPLSYTRRKMNHKLLLWRHDRFLLFVSSLLVFTLQQQYQSLHQPKTFVMSWTTTTLHSTSLLSQIPETVLPLRSIDYRTCSGITSSRHPTLNRLYAIRKSGNNQSDDYDIHFNQKYIPKNATAESNDTKSPKKATTTRRRQQEVLPTTRSMKSSSSMPLFGIRRKKASKKTKKTRPATTTVVNATQAKVAMDKSSGSNVSLAAPTTSLPQNSIVTTNRRSSTSPKLLSTKDRTSKNQQEVLLLGNDDDSTRSTNQKTNDNDEIKSKLLSKKNEKSDDDWIYNSNYMVESSMMRHNLLSMEEEQELSLAIHRARSYQKILDQIMSNKNRLSKPSSTNRNDAEDEDDDGDDNDEEISQDENEIISLNEIVDNKISKKRRKRRMQQYGIPPKTTMPASIYESYYVGSDDYGGDSSLQVLEQWNDMNVLRTYDSMSRLTQIMSSQSQLVEDDDCDGDNSMREINKASINVIKYGDGIHPESAMSDEAMAALTDDEVHKYFQIEGGINELQRILYDGALARDQLIRSNLKLVNSIAKKWSKLTAANHANIHGNVGISADSTYSIYRGGWDRPSLSDAIQEGTIGLTEAVERFNPSQNLRFSTYATYWITNSIRQCFQRSSTGCLRLPALYYDIKARYQKTLKYYYQTTGIIPPLEKIAIDMKIPFRRLISILEYTKPLVSIDAPLLNGNYYNHHQAGKAGGGNILSTDELLSDTLVYDESSDGDLSIDDTIELSFLRQSLENALANELHPTERDIIRLRLGLDDDDDDTSNWNMGENEHRNNIDHDHDYYYYDRNSIRSPVESSAKRTRNKRRNPSTASTSNMKRTCQEISEYYFRGQLSSSEIRSTEQRAYKKLRSPKVLSTYKLLTYLDLADIDTETIKLR